MTERDEWDEAGLPDALHRLVGDRPRLAMVGTPDAAAIADLPVRRWDALADSIVGILADLEEEAEALDPVGALELANVVGPLGIAMQLFARRLIGRQRPEPGPPYGGRRVYFARSVDGGPVLLGSTVDVAHALKGHAYRSRTSLRLLGWLPGDRRTADVLRARFAAARTDRGRVGSWFEPVPELLNFIEKECNHGAPDPRWPARRRRTTRRIALD